MYKRQVVVSGGALGTDTAVHQGALKGSGGTVAVLGTGVERVFPASNRALYEEIRENGCLLSQFPVGTPSLRQNFPDRNFTIAALSHALVVVEAPEISGALITARNAAELGRSVFVLPGPITQRGFVGSHGLIRDGATLVDHPDQVLEQLNIEAAPSAGEQDELNEIQQKIFSCLSDQPVSAEKISEESSLDAAEVLGELTTMEMEGLVIRDAGGYALKP